MPIVHLNDSTEQMEPAVVCLGYFDGVHLGHAALISHACEIAGRNNLMVYAHTFDSSPARRIHPGRFIADLTPLKEKDRLLEALGVNAVAVSRFDEKMMTMPGKEFIEKIIYDIMHAAYIVAGFHHVFGYHGDTDANALKDLCAACNIGCDILPPVRLSTGELISSTAIRVALENGDFEKAAQMLGRPCDNHMKSLYKRNHLGGIII
jgi:riboflavin kinase / FMN adenylyltransferase